MAEKVMVFDMLKSLKNHIKLITIITFLSISATWLLLDFVLAPNYQATSQLYINQHPSENAVSSYSGDKVDPEVVESYSAMIKSREVLAAVISSTGSSMTPAELFDKVTITNIPDSLVLNITVEENNGKIAGEIANSLAEAAIATPWTHMKSNNLTIIAKASVEEIPSILEGNLLYVLAIGGFFGTIVGVLLACINELFSMLSRTGMLERRKKHANLQTVFK